MSPRPRRQPQSGSAPPSQAPESAAAGASSESRSASTSPSDGSSSPSDGSSRMSRIARRAYEIYERRGGQQGQELEDWLQAEREVDSET